MLPSHQTLSIHWTITANSDCNTYWCRNCRWCCNFTSDFISKSNWSYPNQAIKGGQARPTRKHPTQHIWPTIATVTNQYAVIFAQRLAHNCKKKRKATEGAARNSIVFRIKWIIAISLKPLRLYNANGIQAALTEQRQARDHYLSLTA